MSLQYEESVCRGRPCSAAVTHGETHTQKRKTWSDKTTTLQLASILPHFQAIHALGNYAVTSQQRNAMEKNTKSHEADRKWMEID